MAVALETFVKQLTDSGIIAPGKLETFLPPQAHPKDVSELARQLVQQKQLTKFQAQEVYLGRAKSLILGNYTLLDKIGAGGMGQVFKAVHRRMERDVAIKMLPAAMTKDPMALARFQREVKAAAKLRHTNIVAADDADEAGGVHFLVMEYVEGQDLSVVVKKNGPLSVSKAIHCILQAARGLEYAHQHGVVHRDIKPANLLLSKEGTVKILDMGLARIEQSDGPAQAELTGTGTIMGTVDYMAPEQGMSTKHADARADIYSLGCTLYHLLTGKATYDGETVAAKLVAHHTHPIPDLGNAHRDVSEQLQAVFKQMMAKRVEDRYQTMSEVIAALEQCSGAVQSASSIQAPASADATEGTLAFLKDATVSPNKPAPAKETSPAPKPGPRRPGKNNTRRIVAAVAGGTLSLAILAAVIISLRTKDGTLVVEINQPDAVVEVRDVTEATVVISRKGGAGNVTLSVDPGKHRLKVSKDGFAVYSESFEIESGREKSIRAKLVPLDRNPVVAASPKTGSPAGENTPDRKSAQWLLDHKFACSIAFSGKELSVAPGAALPTDSFNVVAIGSDWRASIPREELLAGLSDLKRLTKFRGGYLPGINADTWAEAYATIPSVDAVNAVACDLTDEGLAQLARLPRLGYLNLDGCRNVSAAGLSALRSCKSLGTIELDKAQFDAGKFKLTDVQQLQNALPKCRIVFAGVKPIPGLKPGSTAPGASNASVDQPLQPPAFQQWMKTVASLPAEKQGEAVAKKLVELNPGFDGKVGGAHFGSAPGIENGSVTEFGFYTDNVTDISPLRALPDLHRLDLHGSVPGAGKLTDLAPLAGMKLTALICYWTRVADLSPLRQMPLTILDCGGTSVSDLSPLADCRSLDALQVHDTNVSAEEVAAIQKTLPDCRIQWPSSRKFYNKQ